MAHIAKTVFERTGDDNISRGAFNAYVASFIVYGIIVSAISAIGALDAKFSITEVIMVAGISPLIGIALTAIKKFFFTFIGYTVMSVPFGIILGPTIMSDGKEDILMAMFLTAFAFLIMGLIGYKFPKAFNTYGGTFAILTFLISSIIGISIIFGANLGIFHYLAMVVFTYFVGFDLCKVHKVPASCINALHVVICPHLNILSGLMKGIQFFFKKD